MSELVIKFGVLATLAFVFLLVNLKAGSSLLKVFTFWAMIAALGGAGYVAVLVVLR